MVKKLYPFILSFLSAAKAVFHALTADFKLFDGIFAEEHSGSVCSHNVELIFIDFHFVFSFFMYLIFAIISFWYGFLLKYTKTHILP
jgi:hypothetical protein